MKVLILRKALIVFIILILFQKAEAQKNSYLMGIAGGPSFVLLRGNDFFNNTRTAGTGFSLGITAEYFFSDKISLHANVGLERKGTRQNLYTFNNNHIVLKTYLDYFTVPVLLRFYLGNSKVKMFVEAGGFAGYLNKEREKSNASGLVPATNVSNTSYYYHFDSGAAAGAGFLYPLTEKLNASFNIRYNYGIASILKKPDYVSNGADLFTRSVNCLFSFSYRLK